MVCSKHFDDDHEKCSIHWMPPVNWKEALAWQTPHWVPHQLPRAPVSSLSARSPDQKPDNCGLKARIKKHGQAGLFAKFALRFPGADTAVLTWAELDDGEIISRVSAAPPDATLSRKMTDHVLCCRRIRSVCKQ
ncbi:uncharacterized protein [Dermacentor albipictus]|uniref:uncharacterized protein n=1 Tax=Dermacentor albipictus TaxID=60249 RepID=UPI0031FC68E9